jgi:hypothetical protein
MIDPPVVKRAERIMLLARRTGMVTGEKDDITLS